MALLKRVIDDIGRNIELYIRLNSAEVSNHGVAGHFLFRGYASKEAFLGGWRYLWEMSLDAKTNVGENIWAQAYYAIRSDGDVDC